MLVTATVLVAAVVAAPGAVAPGTAAAQGFCRWQPEVLPLPADASNGYVSAGAGDWYAGSIEEPGSGAFDPVPVARWHDGTVESIEPAFDKATNVADVNESGDLAAFVWEADFAISSCRPCGERSEGMGAARAGRVQGRGPERGRRRHGRRRRERRRRGRARGVA